MTDKPAFQPFPSRGDQEELQALQEKLADRASTVLFAKAGVSLVVAAIFAAAAGKLFWDSAKVPYLGFLASAIALGLAFFAVGKYRAGKRELTRELALFESLQALRRKFRMDDPSALLPP